MKRRLAAILGAASVGLVLSAGVAAADDTADVLVTLGTASITRADLAAFLARTGADRGQGGGQQPAMIAAALERLIDERLLRVAIADAGITIAPEEVQAAVEQLRQQLQSGRGVSLEKALEQSGGDTAGLTRQIEFDLAVARLIGPRIDEAALAAAFARHRRELDGTRVRVSHVILRPDVGGGDDALATAFRRTADIRAAVLRQDLSFAEAAARHSAGPSRHRGGDLGFIGRHGDAIEPFAREAFALDVGGLSQPFATPFGVHLVTVTAVEPGTATLEAVRPQVAELAAREAVREIVAGLRKTTPITYSPESRRLGGEQ